MVQNTPRAAFHTSWQQGQPMQKRNCSPVLNKQLIRVLKGGIWSYFWPGFLRFTPTPKFRLDQPLVWRDYPNNSYLLTLLWFLTTTDSSASRNLMSVSGFSRDLQASPLIDYKTTLADKIFHLIRRSGYTWWILSLPKWRFFLAPDAFLIDSYLFTDFCPWAESYTVDIELSSQPIRRTRMQQSESIRRCLRTRAMILNNPTQRILILRWRQPYREILCIVSD